MNRDYNRWTNVPYGTFPILVTLIEERFRLGTWALVELRLETLFVIVFRSALVKCVGTAVIGFR